MVLIAIKMEVTHLFVLPTSNTLPRKILQAKILYPELRLSEFFLRFEECIGISLTRSRIQLVEDTRPKIKTV